MRTTLAGVAAIIVLAGSARGQVLPTQDGRALDANYGYGSSGYNSIRQSNRAFDANLFITGQVGGGFFAFHGGSPYAGANQLSLVVPSSDLDTFIRQSVGVQYATNPVYGPRAYLAPSQTVLSPYAIASGANAPGTSIPRTAFVPPTEAGLFGQIYQSAISAYKPIMPAVGEQTILGAMLEKPLTPSLADLAEAAAPAPGGAYRPSASALFGVVRESEQQRLARELAETARQTGMAEPLQPEQPPGQAEPLQPGPGLRPGARDQERPAAVKPRETGLLAQPGKDVFLDILLRLSKMEKEPPPPAQVQPAPERPRPEALPPEEEGAEGAAPPRRRPAPPAVEQTRNALILHSLAGTSRDLFNIHMARAEKLMAEGKFYEASEQYKLATILNRDNPLAWMGAGLALFAADEPLSAAHYVREAMLRFPPIMETTVDVHGMLTKQVAEARMEELDRRLARGGEKPEPALLFLATFIRSGMNQPAKSLKDAIRLRDLGGEDKLYQAYADYLLTGKRPAPATQPAAAAPPAGASPPIRTAPPARLPGR